MTINNHILVPFVFLPCRSDESNDAKRLQDPGIRFIHNSSTKRHDRFAVRALISKLPVSDDVPTLKQDDPQDQMQLQPWCQLDLHAHLVHCLHTRLAALLFCSQRVLEDQMQLQAWSQIDLRAHLMYRLQTNLTALLFCVYTSDYSLATLHQAALDSVGSTAAGSNLKPRQKSQKTARRKKFKLKGSPSTALDSKDSTAAGSSLKVRQRTQKTAPRNESKLQESASANKTADFCYTPLEKDEFRLLEIAPGDKDAPLVCTLKHTSLRSVEWFCALSYTWGSPEPPFFIKCNGSDVRITESLHEALCQMRRTWGYAVVWADAICINQSDNCEKSQQVMRMSEIYSKASRLFIWLGNPVTPSDADVVDAILELSQLVTSIKHKSRKSRGKGFDPALEERARVEAISGNDWRKLQDFFLMPWFSRVWVFQEVASVMAVSPRDIRMGYGNRFIDWGVVIMLMMVHDSLNIENPIRLRFPTTAIMVAELSILSAQRKVHFHLPKGENTEEHVAEALARSAPPAGRQMEAWSREGILHTHFAIVIDLCELTAKEYNHSQLDSDRDAALMVEAFNSIFSNGSYLGILMTLHCRHSQTRSSYTHTSWSSNCG